MLNSFLFNRERSERVEDWQAALDRIGRNELLWIALRDTTKDEESAMCQELELGPTEARRLLESPDRASVVDDGQYLYVTLFAVDGPPDAPDVGPSSASWAQTGS